MDSPSEVPSTLVSNIKITKDWRYYQLHAKERNEKNREKYNSDPEVIRKREERLQHKAEKEAEKKAAKEVVKEAARIEKERIREEKLKLAIQTSQIKK